jgi:hypothetical protein
VISRATERYRAIGLRTCLSLFLLFLEEIISQRPLVFGGNPSTLTVRRTKEQPAASLFFRCFPLFLYRSHGLTRSHFFRQ